jgi:tape measure domain-containing protein
MLTLTDHTLQLGWDGSKVLNGIKAIEDRFAKMKPPTLKMDLDGGAQRGATRPRATNRSEGLSNQQRRSQDFKLSKLTRQAEGDLVKLRAAGGKEAAVQIRNLESAIERLNVDKQRLKNLTNVTGKEFDKYARSVKKTEMQIKAASAQSKAFTRNLNAQQFAASGLRSSLGNLARSWVSVFAVVGAVSGFKRIAMDMENTRISALLASGDLKQSADDLNYALKLSNEVGLSYKDTAKAFATFSVAAKSNGVEGKEAREVFTNLSNSIAASGSTAESAKLSFLAFRQMMSGSVIQGQEINQVVDQMPSFLGKAKEALDLMGVSYKDALGQDGSFKDTIQFAKVDAKEFVTTVGDLLNKEAQATGALAAAKKSIGAEQNRAMTALSLAVDKMATGGLGQVFIDVFGGIRIVVEALTPAFLMLGSAIGALSTAIAAPFRLLDKFGQLIGMNEGEGIQKGIQYLAGFLLLKLSSSLLTTSGALTKITAASIASGGGFLTAARGARIFTFGLLGIKAAIRSLLLTVLPLMIAMEGLGWLYSKFVSNKLDTSAAEALKMTDKVGGAGKGVNSKNQTTTNVGNINITQKEGEDGEDLAKRVITQMTNINTSNSPLI